MAFFFAFILLLILITLVKSMATQAEILTSLENQRQAILAIGVDVQDISDSIDENPPADLTPIADSVAQTDQAIADLAGQVKAVVAKFPPSV